MSENSFSIRGNNEFFGEPDRAKAAYNYISVASGIILTLTVLFTAASIPNWKVHAFALLFVSIILFAPLRRGRFLKREIKTIELRNLGRELIIDSHTITLSNAEILRSLMTEHRYSRGGTSRKIIQSILAQGDYSVFMRENSLVHFQNRVLEIMPRDYTSPSLRFVFAKSTPNEVLEKIRLKLLES